MLGLGVAEVLHRANIELKFDLEIVGFSEEEGIRYSFPFIGSLGMTGDLTSEELDRTDRLLPPEEYGWVYGGSHRASRPTSR